MQKDKDENRMRIDRVCAGTNPNNVGPREQDSGEIVMI
jgi:hypothetical protein